MDCKVADDERNDPRSTEELIHLALTEADDDADGVLRAKGPILVTRRGRLAGIYFPRPESTLPVELKRELFSVLSAEVARQISERGLSEEKILADFQSLRARLAG